MFSSIKRDEKKMRIIRSRKALKAYRVNRNLLSFFNNIKEKTNSLYLESVLGLWRETKKQIICGITMTVACCLVFGAANTLDLKLGYEVIIDGENMGIVTNKDGVYDIIESVKADMIKYTGDDKGYSKTPVFVTRMVSGDKVTDLKEIKNHLLSHIDYMVDGVGIYVDGAVVMAVTSKDAADYVLEKHMSSMAGENCPVVEFVEKVETEEGFFHIGMLKTPEEGAEILKGKDNIIKRDYVVEDKDTLWEISKKFDISVERLLALNGTKGEKIKKGDVLKIEEKIPVISVRGIRDEEYNEKIEFEIETLKDSTMYENTTVVAQKGVPGESRVIAKITTVNGVEKQREILKRDTLSEPVKQIERIGTKKRPKATGSGSFIKPSYGSLSSRYGARWGRSHNGIDISGSYNSDIKASDGGVVTYSGWMDGYGNYIVIDHENGYQTGYGHCASLNVKEGDRVIKGQVIAKMGNTGRVTGTHLHFEVKKNGEFLNPLEFVGY